MVISNTPKSSPAILNHCEPQVHLMLHVSVGVIVRNEEKNIVSLLKSISCQILDDTAVDEVIVVSSGSVDRTNELVFEYSTKDSRVSLITQVRREGKAVGIDEFLRRSQNEIVIVTSGDVIFDESAVQNLIYPFAKNRRVGMTSAKIFPLNSAETFMGFVALIHWRLHNVLERHGETIAFRKNLAPNIPAEISADEAYFEAVVYGKGFQIIQAGKALVFNKGSETIPEFLGQLRRHYAGHLFIKNRFSYVVSSMTSEGIAKVAGELLKYMRENPRKISHMAACVILEIAGRFLGMWDLYFRKERHNLWTAAQTTKDLNKEKGVMSRK